MAGQLFADDGRDHAAGQHAMGDAALKDRVLRIGIIRRPPGCRSGRYLGKQLNVAVGDGLVQTSGPVPNLQILDADRAAGRLCWLSSMSRFPVFMRCSIDHAAPQRNMAAHELYRIATKAQ